MVIPSSSLFSLFKLRSRPTRFGQPGRAANARTCSTEFMALGHDGAASNSHGRVPIYCWQLTITAARPRVQDEPRGGDFRRRSRAPELV
jgi:hypothetical protein